MYTMLTVVFALLFFAFLIFSLTSIIMWLKSIKTKKSCRKWGTKFFLSFFFMLISLVVFTLTSEKSLFSNNDTPNETDAIADTPNDDAQSLIELNWRDQFSDELVAEIESAFIEIGENPENIVNVEYVSVRETDLFDRRDYYVEFDKGELEDIFDAEERPWVHSSTYRITTEEWHDGEPEREQYPREYLVTIKFWYSDNSTNILQWSHTGNGELQ